MSCIEMQFCQHCTTFIKNKQYTSMLCMLSLGFSLGYSANLVMFEPQQISDISVELLLACYISSGAITSSVIMQIYGRKPALQLAALALVSGSLIRSLEGPLIHQHIGYMLICYAAGIMAPALCVFVAESSPIGPRNLVLQSIAGPIVFVGTLISFLSSLVIIPVKLYLLAVFASLACLVFLNYVPESPLWLKASSSFKQAENFKLLTASATTPHMPEKSNSLRKMTFYAFLQQACHIIYYDMAKSDLPISPGASALYIFVFGATPSLIFSAVVNNSKRRILTLLSSIVVCVTYIVAAEFEICLDTVGTNWNWFRKSCVFMNLGFGIYGMYAVPWVMIVENTSVQLRGIVTSFLWLLNYIMFLFWLKVYIWILPYIENGVIAIIFMMMAVLVIFFQVSFSSTAHEETLMQIERRGYADEVDLTGAGDDYDSDDAGINDVGGDDVSGDDKPTV